MFRMTRTEDGLTLTELMVALFLLVVVSAVFLPSLISGMRATTQISNVARSNDDARMTLQRIDREIRADRNSGHHLSGQWNRSREVEGQRYNLGTGGRWSRQRNGRRRPVQRSGRSGPRDGRRSAVHNSRPSGVVIDFHFGSRPPELREGHNRPAVDR